MKTLITLVLDRSGSMAPRVNDVIGGVNRFIEEQKRVPSPAVVSFVRFDTVYELFRPSVPLEEVSLLQPHEFQPRGGTALLDAVGRTLGEMDLAWARHYPDRAIVVIVTDGEENSSKEFTLDRIRRMIRDREESGKWTFIYIGADLNTFAAATQLGIQHVNTARYVNTSMGTQTMYGAVSESVANLRTGVASNAGLGKDLNETPDPAQPWGGLKP